MGPLSIVGTLFQQQSALFHNTLLHTKVHKNVFVRVFCPIDTDTFLNKCVSCELRQPDTYFKFYLSRASVLSQSFSL